MAENATAEAAVEPAAEADTIKAESQQEEARNPASAEDKGDSRVEDSYSSTKDVEENAEGDHTQSVRSASSEDYRGKAETYRNVKPYGGKVTDIKAARATKTARASKISGSKDISDKLQESEAKFAKGSIDEKVEDYLENQHYTWREMWHIMKGFLEPTDIKEDENIYRVIDQKAKGGEPLAFLLPGMLQFPYNGRDFEKYSGLSTIRVESRDPDELHNILSYGMEKTGVGSFLIGYSDGEKRAHSYFEKYGGSKVSMFYGLDSDKGKVEQMIDPRKVIYINGAGNLVRGFESVFGGKYDSHTNRPLIAISGATHAGLVHNPVNIMAVGDIIKRTAGVNYSGFETRKAA